MVQVNVHEAKARLSELVERALAGEEVVIARRNQPVIRLIPTEAVRPVRRVGTMKGQIRMADDFDEPLAGFGDDE